MQLSHKDIEILNSKLGLRNLFSDEKVDVRRTLRLTKYEIKLRELQAELIKLQTWAINNKKKIIIIFEGRDAAGKGGAIRRITAHINPRHYQSIALSKPTVEEEGQWYFQRYVNKLPKPGEIVFFDRSWYNRAVVEPVNRFCTKKQYETFMGQVNEFEKMILESDTYIIKFYFSISKREQKKRFLEIQKDPLKKWKMSAVDKRAQRLWYKYTEYKEKMFAETSTKRSPWIIINANRKTNARIKAIEYILSHIPYKK